MNHRKFGHREFNTSIFFFTLLILVLVLGLLVLTKEITLVANVTLQRPSFQISVTEKPEEKNKSQEAITFQEISSKITNPTSKENVTLDVSLERQSKSIPKENAILDFLPIAEKQANPISKENVTLDVLPIAVKLTEKRQGGTEEVIELPPEGCDLSTGIWVFDNITRPLYKEEQCGFLTSQLTCIRNGREDTLYQNWRWQPRDCSLPKFKAKLLLEKLRSKKLLYVGDSVNRNQWESMVCLLQSSLPPGKSTWKIGAPLSVFTVEDYNATIEFYWAPFIVESNSDDPRNHSISKRIISPESISKHGIHWKGADFLVFNTYIWWLNSANISVQRGTFDEQSVEQEEVERAEGYERVMRTWTKWLQHNVDFNRTLVFFTGMSPVHQKGANWNNPDGVACAKETTPILNTSMALDMGTDRRLNDVLVKVINERRIPVIFLDITTLSEYRKDAHTQVYTIRQGKLLTPEQKADPATFADCLHWCVPGLPDTWNELLYTRIISRS